MYQVLETVNLGKNTSTNLELHSRQLVDEVSHVVTDDGPRHLKTLLLMFSEDDIFIQKS